MVKCNTAYTLPTWLPGFMASKVSSRKSAFSCVCVVHNKRQLCNRTGSLLAAQGTQNVSMILQSAVMAIGCGYRLSYTN